MKNIVKNFIKNKKILAVLLVMILLISGVMLWKYTLFFALDRVLPINYIVETSG